MENINDKKTKVVNEMMAGKYLDPKADLTFKLVFGEHKDLVMSLLNALLPLEPDGQITSVEYLPTELVPENPGKKDSVVDVRCEDQQGRQFIVEMQMYWNQYFKSRVLLNASKAVVKQLKDGEGYNLIQPVYCLNLINDIGFESGPDEFYHDYAIVNVAHSDRIIEGKKMAVLWLRFLTEINRKTDEAPAELLENEATRKALSLVEKSAMTEAQLHAYDKFWMAVTDEAGFLEARYHRGMTEGLEKGRAEGMEKGRAEGRAEGVAKANREHACKMKALNMPDEIISQITGLSMDEIEKL